MGVKHMKTLIEKYCSTSYTTLSLFSLANQTIVVDTNLYMYKFKSNENQLIYEFENMLKKFTKYNINPVFVFDGKPKLDKFKTIERRRKQRLSAYQALDTIKDKLAKTNNKLTLKKLEKKLVFYENKVTKLYSADFENIKALISKYGYQFIQADNEADDVCAKHHLYSSSFAVMSEDMDLIMYGCNFIMINTDFNNETFDLLCTKVLFKNLNIKCLSDFQQMCILSGTDYNKAFTLYVALCLYYIYIQTKRKHETLFTWCINNDIISYNNYLNYNNIQKKFII